MNLRERAGTAWDKYQRTLPMLLSTRVENWIADHLDVECDKIIWESQWEGEAQVEDLYLWVMVENSQVFAFAMQRCDHCGKIVRGCRVNSMATLGKSLARLPLACPKCKEPYDN